MNALETVLHWRPQTFGSRSSNDVRDPIVEPLWSGLRVLAAVGDDGVLLQDTDGDRLDAFPDIEAALATAAGPGELILDGYVTSEVSHDGTGTFTGGDGLDSASKVISQSLIGARRGNDDKALDKGQTARMPRGDDPVALVVVDLLWLDGTPLLDVPLLERRRLLESVLEESDLVRRGMYVRPPIDTWVGSWRSMGFPGMSFKAANGRYAPGVAALDWARLPLPHR